MPDRIADHYERHAAAFDAARDRRFPERAWLDRFLMLVAPGADLLDLGCGGGEPVARHLIDAGRRVLGVDASDSLIALARTRFPAQRWLCADMRTAAIDGHFAGVLAWDSLFHLAPADQVAMIARIGNWLAPGAPFLFNTGPDHGEVVGAQFGDPLYHASLAPSAYRARFAEAGLVEVAFAHEDPTSGGRTIWLVRKSD
ncbi:class I SAM-dependent methyltransferase [Sphingomonas hengshuiensis]|uniref:Methyltransferase domain-containing protein n=1 Tax=Sphingomonas hengshuiensis TaxID=1609977 RepID=A0A7U4J678_9SPHN|nr:class I SAM-dependent methyltransferase [Sphingomonas hengshuiensis]AJP71005.1 hypothetical protein TS85_02960 [Sphingomonas hengshuiensis]